MSGENYSSRSNERFNQGYINSIVNNRDTILNNTDVVKDQEIGASSSRKDGTPVEMRRLFYLICGVNLLLWLFSIIFFQSVGGKFVMIPAIILSLTLIISFVRYNRTKNKKVWLDDSFQEYKATETTPTE